jgi:hypothetical protein
MKYSVRPELVEGLVVHGSTSSPFMPGCFGYERFFKIASRQNNID